MINRKPLVPNNRSINTLTGQFQAPKVFANQGRNAGKQLANVRTISGRGKNMGDGSGGGRIVGR
jgi:hypothetical protein